MQSIWKLQWWHLAIFERWVTIVIKKNFLLWLHKGFVVIKIIQKSFQDFRNLFQRVQIDINQFSDIWFVILLLSSIDLTDAFVWQSFTKVQPVLSATVLWQSKLLRVVAFKWISSKIPRI